MKNSDNCDNKEKKIRLVTLVGMISNLFLTFVKVVAGYAGNSQALITDGIHSLSDCSTDIALLVGVKYWNKPADKTHPYGHKRIETIVATFIGLFLVSAAIFMILEAIESFRQAEFVAPSSITLAAALISVAIKEILYRWTFKKGRELGSPAMQANAWHHRSDCYSSIAVSIAITAAIIEPSWAVIDPVATIVVAILILQVSVGIIMPGVKELADQGAEPEVLEEIKDIVMSVEGVKSAHGLRTRFHGAGMQVDIHLQVAANLTVEQGHSIAGKAKAQLIDEGPGIVDVLVHIEPWHENNEEAH